MCSWQDLKTQAEKFEVKATFPHSATARGYRTSVDRLHPVLAEVSVREHQRGHQGPQVYGQAEPAGADLHPHCRHAGLHGLVVALGPGEPGTRSEGSRLCVTGG